MPDQLILTTRNTWKSVVDSAALLERFAERTGIPARKNFILGMAFEELLTNIIKYAYDDQEEHETQVTVDVSGEDVVLTVADYGHEFNPWEVPAPEQTENLMEKQIGGEGLHLIRKMSRSVSYQRKQGQNIVQVRI